MNIKQYSLPYCLAVFFCECCYLLPLAKASVDIPTISIFSFVIALVLFNRNTITKLLLNSVLIAIPYILLSFIVARQLDVFYGLLHPLLLLWYTLFPAILAYDLIKRNKRSEVIFTAVVSIILFAYVSVNTLIELQANQYVLRELTGGGDSELLDQMESKNVGGFGFAYAAGVFLLSLFSIIINSHLNNKYKVLLTLFAFLLFFLVMQAQFTTLLFLVIFTSCLILYLRSNKISRVAIILFSPLLLICISYFLTYLVSLYEGTVVGEHLQTFYYSIWEKSSVVDSAGARSNFMVDAFWTGLNSPIWGQSTISGQVYYITRYSHSDMLATFIGTGIIGVYSRYKSIVFVSRKLCLDLGKELSKRIYSPIILYYLLLSFFNPIDQIGDVAWTSFLIVPIVYQSIFKYL